jgi:hypothetical protein
MKEQASERAAAEKVKQNTFSEECLAWHPRRSQREREMMFSLPLTPQKQLMLARGKNSTQFTLEFPHEGI